MCTIVATYSTIVLISMSHATNKSRTVAVATSGKRIRLRVGAENRYLSMVDIVHCNVGGGEDLESEGMIYSSDFFLHLPRLALILRACTLVHAISCQVICMNFCRSYLRTDYSISQS